MRCEEVMLRTMKIVQTFWSPHNKSITKNSGGWHGGITFAVTIGLGALFVASVGLGMQIGERIWS